MKATADRRLTRRMNIYLPIRIRPSKFSTETAREHGTFTINVSSDGVYFLSRERYHAGALVALAIDIPQNAGMRVPAITLRCNAEIIRSEPFAPSSQDEAIGHYGVAARFRNGFRIAFPRGGGCAE